MAQTKKKTIWKRWYMIVLYCFVGLIVIGSLLPDSDNSETNINSQVNVEQETLTIEQQMEKSVVEILGSSNRKVDRLVEFDYLDNLFPQDEGRIAVANIRFNINDNLNKNYTTRLKIKLFFEYLELAEKYKISFPQIKTHAVSFTKGLQSGAELRKKIMSCKDKDELVKVLSIAK